MKNDYIFDTFFSKCEKIPENCGFADIYIRDF